MPAIMTLGGIALAVLGLLIAFAGMPDRSAGLGLGSDLIQTGASIFAGGLVVAALGQVLKGLKDVADRIDDAGFLSGPRQSLNDELSDRGPVPLPRAAARGAVTPQDDGSEQDEQPAAPVAREPRAARAVQPAPRSPAPAPRTPSRPVAEPQRVQSRAQPQADLNLEAPQHDDFADEFPAERQAPRAEPRWMRAQAGVIPMQSDRASRATPVAAPASSAPPRREAAPIQPQAYDTEPRRRSAPQQQQQPQPEPEDLDQGEPTVVRSGIIAGMAYTLYSDRSIEAELPSGLVRFNSLNELQEHVKRAGVEAQDEEYSRQNGAQH